MKKRWADEYKDLNLGDKRLDERLYKIMDNIWESPNKTLYLACGTRGEAKAAYRFLSNGKVEKNKIKQSIKASTLSKIEQNGAKVILSIQDTTSISYGERKKISDMGYYCDSEQRGMNVHTAIAVTTDGLPLGLLHQEYHTREKRKEESTTKEQRQFRKIEEKESYQWLNSMKEARAGISNSLKLIHVCDREGDIYEMFDLAKKEGEVFLVRVLHNRLTTDNKKVMSDLEREDCKGTLIVRMARNVKESIPARDVLMNFTYKEYEIKCPVRRREAHISRSLKVTGIYIHEAGKPNKKAITWFLLTNDTIRNDDEAISMIKNYTQRWKVERFHYILKSGCNIEYKQSRTYEKLCFLTLLYSVIAMMILHLTYAGRLCPNAACDSFFEEDEWKVLYCIANRTKRPPKQPYSIHQAIGFVAALGGFVPAPSDSAPGAKVIWLGLQKLWFVVEFATFLS